MSELLRLPVPGSLTAAYVVVDPGDDLGPSVLSLDAGAPVPEGESVAGWWNGARVEPIGPDHPILPAPALLAGGGVDPGTLARVYERRHLLVSVTVPAPGHVSDLPADLPPDLEGDLGPDLEPGRAPSPRPEPDSAAAGTSPEPGEPPIRPTLVAHLEAALTAGTALAGQSGGLLLDPVTARFVTAGNRGSGRGRLLRISAASEVSGLRMRTMGLPRFGVPELCMRALPPYLGPAWARLMWSLSWRLVGMIPAVWPDLASSRAGGPAGMWSFDDEIALSATGHGDFGRGPDPVELDAGPESRVRLALDLDADAGAGSAAGPEVGSVAVTTGRSLLVVAPRSFMGTEAEWRTEIVNRLLPRART